MTREQKRRVREELRACGQGKSDWAGVITLAMDYYEAADPVCKRLLQMRYLDGDAGGAGGGEAAHRADDLLPQGAGSTEHRGSVCGGGRAVIALP